MILESMQEFFAPSPNYNDDRKVIADLSGIAWFLLCSLSTIFAAIISFLATAAFYILYFKYLKYSVTRINQNDIQIENEGYTSWTSWIKKKYYVMEYGVIFSPIIAMVLLVSLFKQLHEIYRKSYRYLNTVPTENISDLIIERTIAEFDLSNALEDAQIPKYYTDPISLKLIGNPVINVAGQSYNRTSLLTWYNYKNSDPNTGMELNHNQKKIFPNLTLEKQIIQYLHQLKAEKDRQLLSLN